jgi:Ca2+-dependent lipid-binding protein
VSVPRLATASLTNPAPQRATSGTVVVTVGRAWDLANRDVVGKQDPYIKVAVKGQTSPRSRGQTSAIMKGGTDVTFDAAHGNVLTLAYRDVAAGSPLTLVVEAFDKDAGTADDVIGFGEVVVDTAVLSPRGRQYTCELHDSKSKPCGKVSITVVMSPAPGAVAPSSSAKPGVCLIRVTSPSPRW